jgi:uncharacterized protein (TIGR00369 family)
MVIAPMSHDVPDGFVHLALRPSGYLNANGPFFGRIENGHLVVGLCIEPRHCNAAGHAHGGMLLTLVDVALTVASNFNADTQRFLPTMNVTCDFIAPAPQGSWVQAHTDVLRVTRQHVFSQVFLKDRSGTMIARGSGILLLRGEADPALAGHKLFSGNHRKEAAP